MAPTYRLLWGIPGRSNAIAIAERLGLQSHVLEECARRVRFERGVRPGSRARVLLRPPPPRVRGDGGGGGGRSKQRAPCCFGTVRTGAALHTHERARDALVKAAAAQWVTGEYYLVGCRIC